MDFRSVNYVTYYKNHITLKRSINSIFVFTTLIKTNNIMKTKKRLGIWMDHSIAHLIEVENDQMAADTITAKVGEQDEPLDKRDETLIQNKEQNELADFFSRISDVIINYDEVLLFGPTNAKTELINKLKEDHHFDDIKIEVKAADKMTKNQLQSFVDEHFSSSE